MRTPGNPLAAKREDLKSLSRYELCDPTESKYGRATCTNINFSSRRSKFPSFFNAPAAVSAVALLRGVVKCRGHISFHALTPHLTQPPSLSPSLFSRAVHHLRYISAALAFVGWSKNSRATSKTIILNFQLYSLYRDREGKTNGSSLVNGLRG